MHSVSPVRWTTADLEVFSGDRVNRYEIIDGELFVTRAPHWEHQASALVLVQFSRLGQMRVGWVNLRSRLGLCSQIQIM